MNALLSAWYAVARRMSVCVWRACGMCVACVHVQETRRLVRARAHPPAIFVWDIRLTGGVHLDECECLISQSIVTSILVEFFAEME